MQNWMRSNCKLETNFRLLGCDLHWNRSWSGTTNLSAVRKDSNLFSHGKYWGHSDKTEFLSEIRVILIALCFNKMTFDRIYCIAWNYKRQTENAEKSKYWRQIKHRSCVLLSTWDITFMAKKNGQKCSNFQNIKSMSNSRELEKFSYIQSYKSS